MAQGASGLRVEGFRGSEVLEDVQDGRFQIDLRGIDRNVHVRRVIPTPVPGLEQLVRVHAIEGSDNGVFVCLVLRENNEALVGLGELLLNNTGVFPDPLRHLGMAGSELRAFDRGGHNQTGLGFSGAFDDHAFAGDSVIEVFKC